eukprot:Filipodium_phascolosomae@DN7053_c0_g1_i1.p1
MDTCKDDVADLLEFDCVSPMNTVWRRLEEKGGLQLLEDPLVRQATSEIRAAGKSRGEIDRNIHMKERAIKELSRKYAKKARKNRMGAFGYLGHLAGLRNNYDEDEDLDSDGLSEEDVEQCLYSLGDHSSYLRFNCEPVEMMIAYLKQYFHPDLVNTKSESLAIEEGVHGARLTHNHQRQFLYVYQTLLLWKEIQHDMFTFWHLAEDDMLDSHTQYRLRDTGQGLNRVQPAPRVSGRIHTILRKVQSKVGWVGSSTVHLGDHNVPNALLFIDKYTQVPRILSPIVLCLQGLDKISRNPNINDYICHEFGDLTNCRR